MRIVYTIVGYLQLVLVRSVDLVHAVVSIPLLASSTAHGCHRCRGTETVLLACFCTCIACRVTYLGSASCMLDGACIGRLMYIVSRCRLVFCACLAVLLPASCQDLARLPVHPRARGGCPSTAPVLDSGGPVSTPTLFLLRWEWQPRLARVPRSRLVLLTRL